MHMATAMIEIKKVFLSLSHLQGITKRMHSIYEPFSPYQFLIHRHKEAKCIYIYKKKTIKRLNMQ